MKKVNVFGIDWDTDSAYVNLPTNVEITLTDEEYQEAINDPDIVANKISDEYGYCINGYEADDIQEFDEDGLYQDRFGLEVVNKVEGKVS